MNHSAGVILIEGNRVLLIKHGSESAYLHEEYGLPAGKIEENESAKAAAAREFSEETGLIVSEEDLQEFPDNYYSAELERKGGTEEWSITFFTVNKYSGKLGSSKEGETEWTELDKLKELKLLPNVLEGIEASQRFVRGEIESPKKL